MLTGRLGLAAPGSKPFTSTAVTFTFGPRAVAPVARRLAAWTRKADWLPPDAESVELRYRDPRRMGKVYVLPAGVERAVAGWEALGPDADDPRLDFATWQSRISRHDGELHGLLKNQAFVAGIGNAYSDEVLWQARLGPFRRRASLAEEESARLWRASREVMTWAVAELRASGPAALRATGSGLPERASQGWPTLPPLRCDARGSLARGLRDHLVPRLPALTPGSTSAGQLLQVAHEPGDGLDVRRRHVRRNGHDDEVAGFGVGPLLGDLRVGQQDSRGDWSRTWRRWR